MLQCRYLAPELAINDDGSTTYPDSCDYSIDTYAFGIIMYEVASCNFAYSDPAFGPTTSEPSALRKQVLEDGRRPSPDIDAKVFGDEVCNMIKLCWDAKPENRPSFVKILVSHLMSCS